jgi:hypothetical protein
MTVIKSTDLDFDQIKENLKTYLESKSEFSDYDFEASGLSNILDVLAYNTHMNGLIANMSINESFLATAQLRSSVISHAETLGYVNNSRAAAIARLNVKVVTTDTSTPSIVLPKYSKFTSSIDDVVYSFQTLEEYVALNDGTGTFQFVDELGGSSLPVYEGVLKTKTFLVGESEDEQVYVIPDDTIDTNTLTVSVYDTPTSSTFTPYTDINNNVRIDKNSTVYIIREVPNGYYELTFSDGNVLGLAPQAGNKIVIQYISSRGELANNGKTFTASAEIGVGGTNYQPTVTTIGNSSGGSAKESIASIKGNAPRAFATQQRLVTAEDYKALILNRYSSVVSDVAAWGGNDNVPPIYGRTYVSLKFKDGVDSVTQQATKDLIQNILSDNLAIMSIDTVFADPETTYLELDTRFDFDPDQTNITARTQANAISTFIQTYVNNNLKRFDSVFRRSLLLAEIDNLSVAILNSSTDVRLQQRFIPTLNKALDYTIKFPAAIASPDAVERRVTTSRFTFNGDQCTIKNRLGDNRLQVVRVVDALVVVDNIGNYNTGKGTVTLTGFAPENYEGDFIKVSVVPGNESTIKPLRNYILDYDKNTSTTTANIDYQNTAITL